ncbi:MAG: EutN/CcmL family microcompartment protein [Deltaproteobacteria bacterium]|nr:EutN/CcmL family microcompartment protein [Deltaproteobacteria bacterium]
MLIAKVIGNVWSTKKLDSLHALRLLFVQPLDRKLQPVGHVLLAADEIGAGDDELVIVTQGAPAMQALKREAPVPVDAVVVGIVDSFEMFGEVK